MIIFYEHLAYFLIKDYNYKTIVDLINSYPKLFPEPSKNQHTYFETVLKFMFEKDWDDFFEYLKLFAEIVKEKVINTVGRINIHLEESKKRIKMEIEAIDVEKLRDSLIESRMENECGQILKQLENIKKFRPV